MKHTYSILARVPLWPEPVWQKVTVELDAKERGSTAQSLAKIEAARDAAGLHGEALLVVKGAVTGQLYLHREILDMVEALGEEEK